MPAICLAHNFLNFLQLILNEGKPDLNWQDEIVRTTCLTHEGEIVNEKIKQFYFQLIDK